MNNLLLRCAVLGSLSFGMLGVSEMSAQSFTPGTTWTDNTGTHINAHGGCVVFHDGMYYWFGEYREKNASAGISCYKSSDLYNWTKVGLALTPYGSKDDETFQDVAPGRTLERPKVIYNDKTGKWVMWIHWENGADYSKARVAVCTSDEITGPYKLVSTFRPNNHDSRDQTLLKSSDGTAYHFCSTNMNTDINVVKLTDDFLGCTDEETQIMRGRRVEATTVVQVDDTYFSTYSECDGWNPAPGHSATVVGDVLGDWKEGETFCVDANEGVSYRSQGAYCFSVKDLGYDPKCFIYYGDRWNSGNIQSSTYVWLPMSVRSGYPTVRNYDSWNLKDVMTDMYRYKRAAKIEADGEYSLLERNSNRLLSRTSESGGFCIMDDDDNVNVKFVFEATSDPYVWKLRDPETGKYFISLFGALRYDSDGDNKRAEWRFVLQNDGYYYVVNENDGKYLSVSGASKHSGTDIYLNDFKSSIPQSFAVYFDSKAHDYEEAAMYTKEYFEEVAEAVKEQEDATSISNVDKGADAVRISSVADAGVLTVNVPEGLDGALLQIYSLSGAVVASSSLSGAGAHSVNVASLSPGLYVATVAVGGPRTEQKIMVR